MSKGVFVPSAELADYEGGRVVWRVNLPSYAPVEDIGVNIGRIEQLNRLAGFESLRVGSYDGDTTVFTPGIDSSGRDGSATASIAGTTVKAETHKSSINSEGSEVLDEWKWTKGQVLLNTSEIDDRVGTKGKNLRDPKQWSAEINTALANGIITAAKKNIVNRPSMKDKLRAPTIIAFAETMTIAIEQKFPTALEHLKTLLLFQGFTDPIILGSVLSGLPARDRKWSLVPGVQVDRLLAVSGLAKTTKIVKKI